MKHAGLSAYKRCSLGKLIDVSSIAISVPISLGHTPNICPDIFSYFMDIFSKLSGLCITFVCYANGGRGRGRVWSEPHSCVYCLGKSQVGNPFSYVSCNF